MTHTHPPPPPETTPEFLEVDGEPFAVIRDVDRLQPFLMSVVSASDHWLFVSSRGGLTAGRRSVAGALFPYVTDDKLHVAHAHTGPYTLLCVARPEGPAVWEPFRHENDDPRVRRLLAKSTAGTQVLFEEVHEGLGLSFRARWSTSEVFGFVRTVQLENTSQRPVTLEVVDGLVDLMPAGVDPALQQSASCLVNAYTRADVDAATGLGVIALQAAIVDQPVAAESLRATTVFCSGLFDVQVLLSTDQLRAVRRGEPVKPEHRLTGRRAAWLVRTSFTLAAGEKKVWRVVADVERDHAHVEALRGRLGHPRSLEAELAADITRGSTGVRRLVGNADGLQCTADARVVAHHQANVLFNIMRGGVFVAGHQVEWRDFAAFVAERNRAVAARAGVANQTGHVSIDGLLAWARETNDVDLVRLASEYLPLTFSRRHGDPSRPWNQFTIRVKTAEGRAAVDYQGNWRDIFQNWEALCTSHPAFLENVVTAFLNASTADGFNPYRLSRAGIDWEEPEEDNPWATIGYWGDHQVVYLGRLLEQLERVRPGRLAALLSERHFVFADVPYRLASAADIARAPRSTIRFDHEADRRAKARVAAVGGDGRLLHTADGALVRASGFEKLLVPVLSKLNNLVLDGGIWMNTQRPEWNDANNALVGNGLSMVTMAQLYRHLAFLARCFDGAAEAEVSQAVRAWFSATRRVFEQHEGLLARPQVSDRERRQLLGALQSVFEAYRTELSERGPGPSVRVAVSEAAGLCRLALRYVEHSLRANRRDDGLYHSYNLLELTPTEAKVDSLYEMLEGQVAVLSAGLLSPDEALSVIDALFQSRLFRDDQQSFLLYPERALPSFVEKNRVPAADVEHNALLRALLQRGDQRLVMKDRHGDVRFAGHLRTVDDVKATLASLSHDEAWAALVEAGGGEVAATFERVFGFKGFTGRSGTMYGYEGLGCIYWHMVSKLLLAVQEVALAARGSGAPSATVERLDAAYQRVRGGLGFNKTPEVFGAFPSDPYSHTPRHAGAQQPGMTGSVKEEIITRLGELGVEVRGGVVQFQPMPLLQREFLRERGELVWFDLSGAEQRLALEPGQLAFTLCQVPITYARSDRAAVEVSWREGRVERTEGSALSAQASRDVLGRLGAVRSVVVSIPSPELR
ncbi:MAG: hypothetical protein SFW67_36345 [Myxococcaceae bacterium]|nr:hypothetical protein [Myxococcaceae bacterium]